MGMTTLVNPIMFAGIKSRSYFLLAALNLLWIPVVFLFYPETCNRSLESIEGLFMTESPFYWSMEKAYRDGGDVVERPFGNEPSGTEEVEEVYSKEQELQKYN